MHFFISVKEKKNYEFNFMFSDNCTIYNISTLSSIQYYINISFIYKTRV